MQLTKSIVCFLLTSYLLGGVLHTSTMSQDAFIQQTPQAQTLSGCYQFYESNGTRSNSTTCRVPGEFEHQQYLLMSSASDRTHAKTIARVIREVQNKIRPVVLVNDSMDRDQLIEDLEEYGVDLENVSVVHVEHDSKWARDFGPTTLLSPNSVYLLDWLYSKDRKHDDDVTIHISRISRTQAEFSPLEIEGGNLISNGNGVIVTSERFLRQNQENNIGQIGFELTRQLGAIDLVVLESLVGEETEHVDMFATFTSPNTVVVGSYDPKIDPINAEILDRNAELLSKIRTRSGPLKVFRIPMGSRHDECWRTYTNCIYANGVLLVPSYGEQDDPKILREVIATYKSLLPGWKVTTVDASDLIVDGGALRCASLNIMRLNQPLESTPWGEVPEPWELLQPGFELETMGLRQVQTR